MRAILALAALAAATGCSTLEDRTVVNAGDEPIRLRLLERAEGHPDYHSPVGPPDGLPPGGSFGFFVDTAFENVLVVAVGDRVVGEVAVAPDGPERIEIDADRLTRP